MGTRQQCSEGLDAFRFFLNPRRSELLSIWSRSFDEPFRHWSVLFHIACKMSHNLFLCNPPRARKLFVSADTFPMFSVGWTWQAGLSRFGSLLV